MRATATNATKTRLAFTRNCSMYAFSRRSPYYASEDGSETSATTTTKTAMNEDSVSSTAIANKSTANTTTTQPTSKIATKRADGLILLKEEDKKFLVQKKVQKKIALINGQSLVFVAKFSRHEWGRPRVK